MVRRSPIAIALALAPIASAQVTLYVNGTCGDNAWSGLSPVCAAPDGPKRTILAGIGAAANGDTVIVADGVYTGTGNKNMSMGGRRLILRSQNGPAACIVDMQGSGRAFAMADLQTPETIVDGFTLRNGFSTTGGAFWFHHRCDITVRNCIITANSGTLGGAVYMETDARPTFIACTFTGNSAATGGAFAITQATRPTIVNCVFSGNTASDRGGAIAVTGSPASAIINCTITGNTAATRAGGLCVDAGFVALRNSILWGNSAPLGAQATVGQTGVAATGSLTVSYSLVQDGQGGIPLLGSGTLDWQFGNLSLDPTFAPEFRLLPGSPAIDAADNLALPPGILTDRDGRPRFVDDPNSPDTGLPGGAGGEYVVDMGAFEFQVCYANCDGSILAPILNIQDFSCFINRFAASDPYANCDLSTTPPVLNVQDFSCFLNAFAAGCP